MIVVKLDIGKTYHTHLQKERGTVVSRHSHGHNNRQTVAATIEACCRVSGKYSANDPIPCSSMISTNQLKRIDEVIQLRLGGQEIDLAISESVYQYQNFEKGEAEWRGWQQVVARKVSEILNSVIDAREIEAKGMGVSSELEDENSGDEELREKRVSDTDSEPRRSMENQD